MPTIRNVAVHVTTQTGAPLAEHGVQRLRKNHLVSCFIESTSDAPFRVSLQPAMPFPDFPESRWVSSRSPP